MSYKINVGISYEAPGKPMEYHLPGEVADLTGWPADDLIRFEAEGIIEAIPAAPAQPAKVSSKRGTDAVEGI